MAARREREMGTVEERVAYLEGQTGEQTLVMSELRLDVRDVRTEMRDLRGEMRDLTGEMNRRFDKVDERFAWLIGFQFATFMAIIAALLNVYFR